ncbi:centrosomal protein of 85 kDa isoform X2 [Electrophorus electricus]|uniref:centrosomal protein of 85 kDa isoform X2 n=1 Tax=Electrophorus electricus TaxID=8005 RepID=UPI0015CFECDE|nr:centrosomal protein of 85 kDa isoform X2 [Electrophorus electricus]
MTTSSRYQSSRPTDMEFQTPAVSEKFQSRFGWQLSRVDSVDADLGATASDSTEEVCSSRSSPSFQPIRSQVPIPTAHVMPSTAGTPVTKPQARATDDGQAYSTRSSSSSSKSSLSKSASSPNLEAQGGPVVEGGAAQQDCLSRYRSLVNGLDHSLFPGADQTRLDDGHRFEMPTVEPTLNQSALLGGFSPDVRMQLHMTGLGEAAECRTDPYTATLGQMYKVLPEARVGLSCSSDCYGKRGVHPGPGASARAGLGLEQLVLGSCDPPLQGRGGELASWQQHNQKVENLRLQLEQIQLVAGGRGHYHPSLYPPPLQAESSQWEAAVKASEGLLKEKELIIERQKQQLCQMEQRLRESELQIHGALMGRGAPLTDVCLLRLQEAQRENAFLRTQFAECSDSFAQEKVEAERRLGAVEAETRRLSDALKESVEKHAEELKKQEERIRNRDKHISNLKKKCQKEAEQSREKQQRIETLERYLADLPTMEDHRSQRKQLEAAEQKVEELQHTVAELEACLEEARSATRAKDSQLEEQRRRERELLTTVTSLQTRVQEGLEDGARLPSLDTEKLREENTALKGEQQRLKKVIEKQLRMMEHLGSQIRSVQQHLGEEESSSQALREELDSKQQELHQLRTAMKELSTQNQDLMEQSVSLRERLQAVEGPVGSEMASTLQPSVGCLTQQLHREMAACLRDLRSLCSVLTQRAQGHDPNLSLLLGISSPTVSEVCEDWCSSAVLQRKLQEALQLRHDVEELRTTVSNRYAQDMGDNCTTQ